MALDTPGLIHNGLATIEGAIRAKEKAIEEGKQQLTNLEKNLRALGDNLKQQAQDVQTLYREKDKLKQAEKRAIELEQEMRDIVK